MRANGSLGARGLARKQFIAFRQIPCGNASGQKNTWPGQPAMTFMVSSLCSLKSLKAEMVWLMSSAAGALVELPWPSS